MPHQEALTVVSKIEPRETDNLKKLLGSISENRNKKSITPFEKFTNIHFARLMILDEAKDLDGNVIQPQLAFLSNFDAPLNPPTWGYPFGYCQKPTKFHKIGSETITS